MTTEEYVAIDNNEQIVDDFTEDNSVNNKTPIDLLINGPGPIIKLISR
jgi:hypothetical protein